MANDPNTKPSASIIRIEWRTAFGSEVEIQLPSATADGQNDNPSATTCVAEETQNRTSKLKDNGMKAGTQLQRRLPKISASPNKTTMHRKSRRLRIERVSRFSSAVVEKGNDDKLRCKAQKQPKHKSIQGKANKSAKKLKPKPKVHPQRREKKEQILPI